MGISVDPVTPTIEVLYSEIINLKNSLSYDFEEFREKFQNLKNDLESIKNTDFQNLQSDLETIKNRVLTFELKDIEVNFASNIHNFTPSLNGAYATFKDGEFVNCGFFKSKLRVISSGFILNEENNYIIVYRLQNESGDTIFIPSIYLSAYIEKSEEKRFNFWLD